MENYRKRKKNLSNTSLKRYDFLFEKYGKKILDEDTDKWLEYLENSSLSVITKRMIYTSIMYNLFDQDISKKKKKDIYETVREELDKTLKKEAEKPSNNVELKYEYDKLKPQKPLTNNKNELLFKLYTKQIPRRVQDYLKMHIWKRKGIPKDNSKNYYLPSKNQFLFNVYKTSKHYGSQTVDINLEVKEILKKYTKNLKHQDKLFTEQQSNLSTKIKKIFGTNLNGIRHAYVTMRYQKKPHLTNDEIKKMAQSMGHSVVTNLSYRAKGLFD